MINSTIWIIGYFVGGIMFNIIDYILGYPASFDITATLAYFILVGPFLLGLNKLYNRSDAFKLKLIALTFAIAWVLFVPVFALIGYNNYPASSPIQVGLWMAFQWLPLTGPIISGLLIFTLKFLANGKQNIQVSKPLEHHKSAPEVLKDIQTNCTASVTAISPHKGDKTKKPDQTAAGMTDKPFMTKEKLDELFKHKNKSAEYSPSSKVAGKFGAKLATMGILAGVITVIYLVSPTNKQPKTTKQTYSEIKKTDSDLERSLTGDGLTRRASAILDDCQKGNYSYELPHTIWLVATGPSFHGSANVVVDALFRVITEDADPIDRISCVDQLIGSIKLGETPSDNPLFPIISAYANYDYKIKEHLEVYKKYIKALADARGTSSNMEKQLSKGSVLNPFMVQKIGERKYEIKLHGGAPAILLTSETAFQSKGWFSLGVERFEDATVKTIEESGGFDRTVAVFKEIPGFEKMKSLQEQSSIQLSELGNYIKEKKPIFQKNATAFLKYLSDTGHPSSINRGLASEQTKTSTASGIENRTAVTLNYENGAKKFTGFVSASGKPLGKWVAFLRDGHEVGSINVGSDTEMLVRNCSGTEIPLQECNKTGDELEEYIKNKMTVQSNSGQ